MTFKEIIKAATLGQPKRLRPMILWTMIEYFFRGAPYGITLFVVWELFKPLESPGTPLDMATLYLCLLSFLVSVVILYFVSRKSFFAAFEDGYRISADGRKELADHLRRLPMGFYNSRDPGDIGAYLVTDYANIENLVTHLLPQFFGSLTMPLFLLAGLACFSWKLALAAALVIPLAWPFVKISLYIIRKVGVKRQKAVVDAASRMIEYIQGIRLIKAFNLGGTKFDRLEQSFRHLKTMSIRLEAGSGPTMIFSSFILQFGFVLIILLGFTLLLAGEVPLAVYVMFLILGMHLYSPLIHAMMFLGELNYSELGVERVEALRKSPLLPEGKESASFDNFEIRLEDVCFTYHNKPVINQLTTTIPSHSLTALVGPSGSGKTTITRLIARFWDVDNGTISIGGKPIREYSTDHLLATISIVFQDVYLFNDTICNNIRIGKEDASEEEIIAAAKAAQCHDFIMALPEGYKTLVGEGGSTLSGGEKQRISIARAILKDAPIVLLDEATASLDPENEWYIQQAINDLVRRKTVIVIAHRLHTISKADKIIVMNQGQVVEEGTHDNLLANHSLYRSLWDEQQRIKGWKF